MGHETMPTVSTTERAALLLSKFRFFFRILFAHFKQHILKTEI